MKHLPLLCTLVVAPTSAVASGFCERMPLDPEVPAGIAGSYEVIGRDPVTSSAYTGTLALTYGKSSYLITRSILGKKVNGEAWIERCGMDTIKVLTARYYTKPVTEISCTFNTDGGNYYRTTCRTRQGQGDWRGLEAWFQQR